MTQHRDRAGRWRREQLKKGASQIKIGVGVIADLDPIDGIQFTPEGMQPADILLLAAIPRRPQPCCKIARRTSRNGDQSGKEDGPVRLRPAGRV
jgi:hypothetical protein